MLFQHLIGIWYIIYFLFTFWSAIIWTWQTNLEDWKILIRSCRTDMCSCKLSAKVSLMLDNIFLVLSLCKLNHISVCFIQISTKSPANSLFPSGKEMLFLKSSPAFFLFQYNVKISIKAARVCRLSFSFLWLCCDYGYIQFVIFNPRKVSQNRIAFYQNSFVISSG